MNAATAEQGLTWHTARADQGQIVQISYSSNCDGVYLRERDGSDQSVSYWFVNWDDYNLHNTGFEPWNGSPEIPDSLWIKIEEPS